VRKADENQRGLPFRKPRYRNLKEALKYSIYSRPGGKKATDIAGEIGITLVDLSRYLSENPDDPRGKILDIFVDLLISLEDNGLDVYHYIGEAIEAAREKTGEEIVIEASRYVKEHGPAMAEALKTIAARGSKK
jgi:hypothetical protein